MIYLWNSYTCYFSSPRKKISIHITVCNSFKLYLCNKISFYGIIGSSALGKNLKDHLVSPSPNTAKGCQLHHVPGQPIPMYNHPFCLEILPNIWSNPSLLQLKAVALYSIISFQVDVENNVVSLDPHLFQTKQPQFLLPLLISLVFQSPHWLCYSSLQVLKQLSIFLVVRGSKWQNSQQNEFLS